MPKIEDMKRIDLPEQQPAGANPTALPWWKRLPNPNKKLMFGTGGGVAIFLIVLVLAIAIPLVAIRASAQKVINSGKELQKAASDQNLPQIKSSIEKTKKDLQALDISLKTLIWVKPIPFLGGYWNDVHHGVQGGLAGLDAADTLVKTVEPYSDILGLNGANQPQDGAQTAEDRLNFIVETIDGIIPQMGTIGKNSSKMSEELSKINPNRYPEYFAGKPVRSKIRKTIDEANRAHRLLTDRKPIFEQLPYLLGINGERTFLFLWQNDKELRPTGGFITAYSIIKVKDGKFEPVVSNDIYFLDNQFKSKIPAPEPIKKYLPLVPYWNLRDMNLSPDFKVSMDTFNENYSSMKSAQKIDGIISVDTYPLIGLLEVMGQLGVPGYGNYSAETDSRCNCPNVIYELESYADVAGPIVWDDISGKIVYKPPHADNRKGFLGPLMNTLIANAMGQPKEKLADLFEVGWNSLNEKHVMFYATDEKVQTAMESFNLAGRLREYDGDYLTINDTNFAGAKSNLYVEHEIDLTVDEGKDGTTNTLVVKYKNPQKYDGWLNGPFRDWVRVYVPQGSKLIDSTGSEVPVTTYEEAGKTVFEGFFTLRPLGVTELHFKYKTPVKGKDYKILVQKQSGTTGHQVNLKVGKNKEEFKLTTDREVKF